VNAPPVVFGVDFSPIMRRAIPWVREFIAPGRDVVLAHAIDAPPVPGFLRALLPRDVAAREVIPQVLARLQTLADRAGIPTAEVVAQPGRAADVLLDVANERGASLLVLGKSGVPTRPWKRVGTTTERIMRAAEESLLIVTGSMIGAPKRLLVAVDDAPVTPCLLARAGALADMHGAELHTVHVLSPAAYSHMLSAEAAAGGDEAERRRHLEADLAEETLRWLRALWANTSRRANLHAEVAHGDPADEILRVARNCAADLILIGRYGIGRLVPAVLGSVAGSVVAGAECPVLVVNA
jgi:nucleotide-binding universal stress UspA family protein